MAEYIYKGALYEEIAQLEELARNRYLDTPSNSPTYPRYTAQMQDRTAIKHLIADFTAADVVPVRHGRWEWREEWNNSTTEHYTEPESCGWYCSHCGIELGDYLTKRTGETIYLDDESRKPFLNRCPNCGFIMDLEDEDHG